jgi:toxin FitB
VNVVDSSAWLEYFADGPNADYFAPAIENTPLLVVPSICVLEVFKRTMARRGEDLAIQAIAMMQQGNVVDLDVPIAISAAKLGLQHRLPLADSVVLATAVKFDATLWTQDSDFEEIPNVRYRAKVR